MNELYERIVSLCREKGITVTDLCRDCAIPRATLSDFKTGRVKTLSMAVVTKISGYFSVSVEFLTAGEKSDNVDALKVALFGGGQTVTDEMWNEVKRYALYIKERENGNR